MIDKSADQDDELVELTKRVGLLEEEFYDRRREQESLAFEIGELKLIMEINRLGPIASDFQDGF